MDKIFRKILIGFLLILVVIAGTEAISKLWMKKKPEVKKSSGQAMANNSSVEPKQADISTVRAPETTGISVGETIADGNQDEYGRISTYLDSYIQLLNEKKYEEAYGLLEESFSKNYFPSLEQFKAYAVPIFPGKINGKLATIGYYYKKGNDFLCQTTIVDDVPNGPDPTTYMRENFTIHESETGKFTISFLGVISVKDIGQTAEFKNITIKLLNETKKHASREYNMQMDNKSPLKVILTNESIDNIYMLFNKDEAIREYPMNKDEITSNLELRPGGTLNLTLKFPEIEQEPLKLMLDNIKFGDEVTNLIFPLKK